MIRIMIIVVLIGILLCGCVAAPDHVVDQKGQYISTNVGKFVVERHIDYDAGVVCYTFRDGIDCMAIEETKLR